MSKTSLHPTRGSSGFTIVEILIVLAIVGIMTAIAIPNYQRYQAKIRQGEAKILLANLYTTELAFAAESFTFTACLFNIGFVPQVNSMNYTIGFRASKAAATVCGPRGDLSCARYWIAGDGATSGGTACGLAPASGNRPAQTVAYLYTATTSFNPSLAVATEAQLANGPLSQTVFSASAVGSISGSPNYDVWTIDQNKMLINTASGI